MDCFEPGDAGRTGRLLVILIPVGWLFYLSFVGPTAHLSLEHYQKMIEYKSYARVFDHFSGQHPDHTALYSHRLSPRLFSGTVAPAAGGDFYAGGTVAVLDLPPRADLCLARTSAEAGSARTTLPFIWGCGIPRSSSCTI